MKIASYIITSTTLLFQLIGFAQEGKPISKDEAINKAMEQNTGLKISQQEYLESRADYRQTNSVFLPNVSVSYTATATTNPLMAFGSKLNQEIISANDFNPITLNDPDQVQNYATVMEFQQPLINIDGVYQRKAAKSKMEAMALKSQRSGEYLELEVTKAYMQLQLAYKAVSVLEKVKITAEENLNLANNSFEQGYLQRADVLEVEVRVGEVKSQLQKAKSNVQNASDYLAFLIDEPQGELIQPSDSLVVAESLLKVQEVPSSRADIQAMEQATQAHNQLYKSNKMAFLPRLNAFGSYQLYDDHIFQADASGYLVGAQLSWDLFQGSKRFGKSQKSKAAYERSKLEYDQYLSQSRMELDRAKRMLNDAENNLNVMALALEQSEESMRIRTNRFKEGLEKTTDVLMAESLYAKKQLEYYQTLYQYNYALAYLEFLTKE